AFHVSLHAFAPAARRRASARLNSPLCVSGVRLAPHGRRRGGGRHAVGADGVGAGLVAAMSKAPVTIELADASFGWHGHPALKSVSGCFAAGGMSAVVGLNGAGKSTLINGIMGVLRPMAGSVRISGGGRSELAWLPQAAE